MRHNPRTALVLRRLDAYLTRADRHLPRHPGRVTQTMATTIALPRFLVWHSYLASRKPTKASLTTIAHRLRGRYFQALARAAVARGLPLPTKDGVTPPAYALSTKERHHERANHPSVIRTIPLFDDQHHFAGSLPGPGRDEASGLGRFLPRDGETPKFVRDVMGTYGDDAHEVQRHAAVTLATQLEHDDNFASLAQNYHQSIIGMVSMLQHAWGNQSDSLLVLALQEAVSREFHVPPPSHASSGVDLAMRQLFADHEAGLRAFVRVQYAQTQAWLVAHHISSMVAHRGMAWKAGHQPDGIQWNSTEQVYIHLRPLSSLSTERDIATNYGTLNPYHLIASAEVPASRIFSLAQTGLGDLLDGEIVVIGGSAHMLIESHTGTQRVQRSEYESATPPSFAYHVTRAADDDPLHWWDLFGWDAGLYPPDILTPEMIAELRAAIFADVSETLAWDDWLQSALSDMTVLQIMEGYWNGQAATFAGQEVLDEAGIAGNFNLSDPVMENYLRYQAGLWVQGINETTQKQLADALWSGFLGEDGMPPLTGAALGRYVQGVMDAWDTGLAGMSRYRANMIAVTETARAETFGQFVAMMQSGVKLKISMPTVGACTICVVNNEQGPIPLMDLFPSGQMAPPFHPWCRDSLAPYTDGTTTDDWAYTYDADQIQAFIDSPYAQYWPYGNLPGANAAEEFPAPQPPPKPDPKNFGLLEFGDLPQAFQDALSPDVIGALRLYSFADHLASAAAQVAAAKELAAEIQQELDTPTTDANGQVYTLDDILDGVTDGQSDAADQQIVERLGEKLSNLDDLLSQLRDTETE